MDYADIEKRLREFVAAQARNPAPRPSNTALLCAEAADAIASLTRELEEARSLLAWIAALPAHTEEDYIESFAAVRLRLDERQQPVSDLYVRVVHASAAEKTMAALSYVMNALWEQDAERDAGVGLTYCGRCEEEGGSSDRHAHWSDVPHSKDCLYAAAAEGMGPATASLPEGKA